MKQQKAIKNRQLQADKARKYYWASKLWRERIGYKRVFFLDEKEFRRKLEVA